MIKKLIYKIEDKIATRFLRRELSFHKAGQVLAIAFDKTIKNAIENKTNCLELTYELTYDDVVYQIKNEIEIEKIEE